jgi:hypothetical protein
MDLLLHWGGETFLIDANTDESDIRLLTLE